MATRGGHAGSSWAHTSAVDQALAIFAKMQKYESSKTVGRGPLPFAQHLAHDDTRRVLLQRNPTSLQR